MHASQVPIWLSTAKSALCRATRHTGHIYKKERKSDASDLLCCRPSLAARGLAWVPGAMGALPCPSQSTQDHGCRSLMVKISAVGPFWPCSHQ